MKTHTFEKALLSSLLIMVTSLPAFAESEGGTSGGGGNTVLCYASKQVRDLVVADLKKQKGPYDYVNLRLNNLEKGFKPQLLDLWEVRKPLGFPGQVNMPTLYNRTAEEIYTMLDPIATEIGYLDSIYEQYYQDTYKYTGKGYLTPYKYVLTIPTALSELKLARTLPSQWKGEEAGVIRYDDSTIHSGFPENCLYAQVAFYDDRENIVHYDQRVVSQMDSLDQAALRVHEDLYKASRARAVQMKFIRSYYIEMNQPAGSSFIKWIDAKIRSAATSDNTRIVVRKLFTQETFKKESIESSLRLILLQDKGE